MFQHHQCLNNALVSGLFLFAGVSSGEYLNYALKNRAEWVVRGEEIVVKLQAQVSAESSEANA